MSKVTKITEEEINKINELQALYQQKIYQLGQLQIDKIALEENSKAIDARQESIIAEWKDLQSKENDVVNSMAEKYGKGSLNLKDGTFTSQEDTSSPAPTSAPESSTANFSGACATPETSPVYEPSPVTVQPTSGNVGVGTSGNCC